MFFKGGNVPKFETTLKWILEGVLQPQCILVYLKRHSSLQTSKNFTYAYSSHKYKSKCTTASLQQLIYPHHHSCHDQYHYLLCKQLPEIMLKFSTWSNGQLNFHCSVFEKLNHTYIQYQLSFPPLLYLCGYH